MADKEPDQPNGEAQEPSFSEAFAERVHNPHGTLNGDEAGGDTGSAAADQPADKAGEVDAPSHEAATDASGTPASAADPWRDLTPEQKSFFERLQASERSNRGRVGALTKKLNETLNGRTQPPPAKQSEDQAGEDDTEGKPEDIEARLDQIAETYSDVNGPVVEVIKELRKEVATLKASATRFEVDADAEAFTDAIGELADKHPDFEAYNDQNPDFLGWFQEQPANIKALVSSFDPKEVSLGLTLYKTERGIATEATTGGDEGGKGGTATGDRRQRQLEGQRQPISKGAPAVAGVPKDFKSAFHARAAQLEKEASR